MSEPRHYRLYLGGESRTGDWHKDPATPKQIARLRYLGVAPHGRFTKGQAGAIIDQTEVDPRFQEAVERWHQDKYRLHPDLYPPPTRDKEDGREWQDYFGKDNVYGHEFHRPTQLQIVQVLEQLDRTVLGWDQGHDGRKREHRFMNTLAEMFPALCKRNCSFGDTQTHPHGPNARQSAVPPPMPPPATVGRSSVQISEAAGYSAPALPPYKQPAKADPKRHKRIFWVFGCAALFIGVAIVIAHFRPRPTLLPATQQVEATESRSVPVPHPPATPPSVIRTTFSSSPAPTSRVAPTSSVPASSDDIDARDKKAGRIWVKGYLKPDGTYVEGYYRKK